MTTKKQDKANRKAESLDTLRRLLPEGTTVYTVLRHCSASGMSRRIDLYVIVDNEPRFLSGYVRDALDYRQHKDGSLIVGGAGMDMGYHLVHSLAGCLFGHNDRGGYKLKHQWL